jgi:hypothetical protein
LKHASLGFRQLGKSLAHLPAPIAMDFPTSDFEMGSRALRHSVDIGHPLRKLAGTTIIEASCRHMARYFFHLTGQLPARDLLGHDCANDREAEAHASFIARRIGTEKLMAREGNSISVTNENGNELFQVQLASTTS